MTQQKEPRLKVAPASIKRFKEKLKEAFHKGRGRNLGRFIDQDLNSILRGWGNYFIHSQVITTYEDLDSWIRRRLRKILWQQWKRHRTRRDNLIRRGIAPQRAIESSLNGRGSWWNSGASHMNEAYPKSYFDKVGLISLLDGLRWRQRMIRTAVYGTVRTVV